MKNGSYTLARLFFAWSALVLITGPTWAQVPASEKDQILSLFVGVPYTHKLSSLPDGYRLDGDYAKVSKVTGDSKKSEIRFRPSNEGVATLFISDSQGNKLYEIRLDVKSSDLTKVAKDVRDLLSDIDGINIRIVNNRIVIDGHVILPRDLNRIYAVIRQFGGLVDTLVELSPLAQKKIAEFIQRDINNPEIQVRAVNDKFMLEGLANNQEEKDRAEIIAKTYVPDIVVEYAEQENILKKRKVDVVINLITVKPEPTPAPSKIIQLVIHYVELKKDYQRAFRFQWMPDITDDTRVEFANDSRSPGGVVSQITGIVSNLLPKLNWAKSHGHARVLQSSTLIVQEGEKGKLDSTTKIPYTIVNQGQTGTSFADAGLMADITPIITNPQSDSIRLDTNFQVSSLVGMTSAGPLLSSNAIRTIITVRSGQSAAIGGLITSSATTDYNKLPQNVSDNPLISLYSSRAFQRNQSQFVVFITPIIKSSASAGSEKIKRKFQLKD